MKLLACCALLCLAHLSESKNVAPVANIGKFWHLSDLHLDFYYDDTVEDATEVCPSSSNQPTINAGPYGDYRCDSPWKLINSSIYAMKELESNPDFILYTGDDTLHTGDEDKYLGEEKVLQVISNLTQLIKDVFPSTHVFSALGNHDYHPKNQMPPGPNKILSGVADCWRDWISEDQLVTFRENGYYSGTVNNLGQLTIVVLNTNEWYSSNKQVNDSGDPGSQFEWLQNVLKQSRNNNKKVYIIGHIPPGYFELVDYKYWLYPEYNKKYIDVVKEYHDIIVGQFFGHHHTDSFRMFYDNQTPISTLWIAPGVTPWMTTLPGVMDGANNPGIRLFHFDKDSLLPTDYEQYMVDLQEANSKGVAKWHLEYQATEFFGVNSIDVASMDKVLNRMKTANPACTDCPDNVLLQEFVLFNTVSYNTAYCNETCQTKHVCAVSEVDIDRYKTCIAGSASTPTTKLALIVGSFAGITLSTFVAW